jgi:hypothetical protein
VNAPEYKPIPIEIIPVVYRINRICLGALIVSDGIRDTCAFKSFPPGPEPKVRAFVVNLKDGVEQAASLEYAAADDSG